MGLIQALKGAVSTTLADQWKEYFYCEALPVDVLVTKGQKRVNGKVSSNTKGSDNIISDGSVVVVADGQCMIIVDQGKVVEFAAEPGAYKVDCKAESSIFSGSFGQRHWKQEVFGFLPRIKKLKNTKKFPTVKFILKGLQTSNDMIGNLIYQVKHIEKDLSPIDISETDALKAIEGYQNWIAQELSTKGLVIPDDVYAKLTEVTGCD